jgi:hypothetical protein
MNGAQRGERIGLIELAFGGEFGEGIGEVIARRARGGRIGVVQTHLQACERCDLRDAASHCARSNNADSLDAVIARGHWVARLHGYFRIARSYNLWMIDSEGRQRFQ